MLKQKIDIFANQIKYKNILFFIKLIFLMFTLIKINKYITLYFRQNLTHKDEIINS